MLKGNQNKLDRNHNGHLDGEDFKMLRSGKKGKKHRKDEDKFIERVVGMLMDRVDELKQSTYQSAAAKAGDRAKAHKEAARSLYKVSNNDKTSDRMATDVSLVGHHAEDQANKFKAKVKGEPIPTNSALSNTTRSFLRTHTDRYKGKGR